MQLKPIAQSFAVEYRYTLYFTEQLFSKDNPLFHEVLARYKKDTQNRLLFVIDEAVVARHPDLIVSIREYCSFFEKTLLLTEVLTLPGGETSKNDTAHLNAVLTAINDAHIDRHSFVVCIGGGALVDMVGYAATIAHRGVKCIRIPTTVLAQNDAAVGVKNSINSFQKKNFLGTFALPYAIINDSHFLTTLEQRDWIAGISEAVKVALIKDRSFFEFIEEKADTLRERNMETMQLLIHRCAEMHMQHIAQGGDPFESGSSRPLDFGHWAAHKMEQMTQYRLRHGEAVAKGIALDVTYAHLTGLLTEPLLERILGVLERIGFDLTIPVSDAAEIQTLLKGIQEFREHLGGTLCITLITGIGIKHDVDRIDMVQMERAVTFLNGRYP